MAKAPRERTTVDLRGLAPALKAQAKARHLSVSDVARLAVAAALETSPIEPCAETGETQDATADRPVKVTVWFRRGVAARLKTRARACGLSHGSYLTTLIDGTTAPSLAMVAALSASTDQLAAISTDLEEIVRFLGRNPRPPVEGLDAFSQRIVDGVHRYLDLASRVVAELRPARTSPAQRGGQ